LPEESNKVDFGKKETATTSTKKRRNDSKICIKGSAADVELLDNLSDAVEKLAS
jgi:hypothetical protein